MLKISRKVRITTYGLMILCLLPLAIQTRIEFQNDTFLYLLAIVQICFAVELFGTLPNSEQEARRHSSKPGQKADR